MATTDTQNAQMVRADGPIGLESIVPPYVTGLVIIGLAVSFLALLVGLVTDRFAVLIAASFALSAVTFVWAVAAAIGLGQSVKNWLATRHAAANEAADTGLSR